MSTSPLYNHRRSPAGQGSAKGRKAFSLVEILVTVSLLSFIVLGLLMMFNQTQKAFRLSMTQVDILESGRMVTDMLSRELEQAAASKAEPVYDGALVYQTTNFFAEVAANFPSPILQGLPGSAKNGNPNIQDSRTNILQNFFFMRRVNQDWIGTGYALIQQQGAHVGSLYRFSATNRPPFANYNLNGWFRNEINRALAQVQNGWPVTNMSRIADGVVNLKLTPYTPNGQPMIPQAGFTNLVYRLPLPNTFYPVQNSYGNFPVINGVQLDCVNSYFVQDAMPAEVELELAVLEPNVLDRYKGLGGSPLNDNAVQRNFLSNHVGNVHIFRQRVPIRNTEFSVYQ